MCWNATISLNTFVFSAATLAFIAYNNTYTKYKLPEFIANPWLYAVIVSFVSIQLVEYFRFQTEIIVIVFVEMRIEISSLVLISWYPDWMNTEIILFSEIENSDN